MTRWRALVTSVVLAIGVGVSFSGCGVIPLRTGANEPLCEQTPCGKPSPTPATMSVEGLPDVFVGIAMSGGGLRAANFSAEALFRLDEIDLLRRATAISSVSGSSITTAYYGLYRKNPERWKPERVRQILRTDLQLAWITWWLNPYFIVQYWLTHFDRSDIMTAVLDYHVFGDRPGEVYTPPAKTFKDMPRGGPRILLNATSLPHVRSFVFSEEQFRALGSRLDTYPVSHAVMASGAFPGAFHNVTLGDFSPKVRHGVGSPPRSDPQRYQHLFDGGPSDNLGVETLRVLVEARQPKACLLILVDAHPHVVDRGRHDGDTRRFLDFVVDRNALDSADVFLTLRRLQTLRDLGYPRDREPGDLPVWDTRWTAVSGTSHQCRIWHLTFQRLRAPSLVTVDSEDQAEAEKLRREIRKTVGRADEIPTAYWLAGLSDVTAERVQGFLIRTARVLVKQDRQARQAVKKWVDCVKQLEGAADSDPRLACLDEKLEP